MDVHNDSALLNSWYYRLTLYVFGTVVFVLILFTNITLFVLVVRYPRLRTRTTLPVVSWAILDLAASLILLSLMAFSHLSTTLSTTYYLCVFWACMQIVPIVASSLHLFLIAMDRYIAVMWPLRYACMLSYRRLVAYTGGTWFYSLLLCCIPLAWVGAHDQDQYCTMTIFPRYYPILPLLHCIVLASTTLALFARVFTHIRRHQRQVHVTYTLTQEQLMADRKMTRVFFYVIIMFLITWLPFQITWFLTVIISDPSETLWLALIVSYLVGMTNSASKIVLYFIFHDDIQTSLKELYSRKPRQPIISQPSVRHNP